MKKERSPNPARRHGECGSTDYALSKSEDHYYINYFIQNGQQVVPVKCILQRYHRQIVSDIHVKRGIKVVIKHGL